MNNFIKKCTFAVVLALTILSADFAVAVDLYRDHASKFPTLQGGDLTKWKQKHEFSRDWLRDNAASNEVLPSSYEFQRRAYVTAAKSAWEDAGSPNDEASIRAAIANWYDRIDNVVYTETRAVHGSNVAFNHRASALKLFKPVAGHPKVEIDHAPPMQWHGLPRSRQKEMPSIPLPVEVHQGLKRNTSYRVVTTGTGGDSLHGTSKSYIDLLNGKNISNSETILTTEEQQATHILGMEVYDKMRAFDETMTAMDFELRGQDPSDLVADAWALDPEQPNLDWWSNRIGSDGAGTVQANRDLAEAIKEWVNLLAARGASGTDLQASRISQNVGKAVLTLNGLDTWTNAPSWFNSLKNWQQTNFFSTCFPVDTPAP